MKLFTKDIDAKLFAQYSKGGNLKNQMVVAKIFNPYGRGTWYLLNSDPEDPDYIWAIVDLFEPETGSVSRSELESIKVPPFRLGLERDQSFRPINAQELLNGLYEGKHYAKGGKIKNGDIVEVKEPNYGYDDDYYVVSNKAGYDKDGYLISSTRKRVSDVFEEDQLKKLYANGGNMDYVSKFDLNDKGNFAANIKGKNYEIIYRDDISEMYDLFENGVKISSDKLLRNLMSFNKYAKGGDVNDNDWVYWRVVKNDETFYEKTHTGSPRIPNAKEISKEEYENNYTSYKDGGSVGSDYETDIKVKEMEGANYLVPPNVKGGDYILQLKNGGGLQDNTAIFDRLKKGDKIHMTYGSTISNKSEKTLLVKSKNLVGKGKSWEQEKITFENVDNPSGVKFFARKRNNDKVYFGIGDMAISNVVITMANKMAQGGKLPMGTIKILEGGDTFGFKVTKAGSGGEIRASKELTSKYAKAVESYISQKGVKKGTLTQKIYKDLTAENYHLLNEFLSRNGYFIKSVNDENIKGYDKFSTTDKASLTIGGSSSSKPTSTREKLNLKKDATYVPKRDIQSVELKNFKSIPSSEIIDGVYRKKSATTNDDASVSQLEKLKSEGKLVRYLDVRGNGKKVFDRLVVDKSEKGNFKRYESASKGTLGTLQNAYLTEEDVLAWLKKTSPKKMANGGGVGIMNKPKRGWLHKSK
jgi:hypothetical protein